MQSKRKKANELLSRFDKERHNSLSAYLENPTPASIKKYLVGLLVTGKLNESDQLNLRGFLGIRESDDLLKYIKENTESFKPIQHFLLRKTESTTKPFLLEVVRILVHTEDEIEKEINSKEQIENENTKEVKSSNRSFSPVFFTLALIVLFGVVYIGYYMVNEEGLTPSIQVDKSGITNDEQNVINSEMNITNNIIQVFPDKETQFFSDNGKPMLWYIDNNGRPEFYNRDGVHPTMKRRLIPVSREVVNEYLKKDQIDTKENFELSKKKVKTIINTSIVNSPETKELSVFIFDKKDSLDRVFMDHLSFQLKSDYQITPPLISSENLTSKVRNQLKSASFQKFGVNLSRHIDVLCVGTVTYRFRENTRSERLLNCDMEFRFQLYDVKTNELIESYTNVITGNGVSEENAKSKTIKKLQL